MDTLYLRILPGEAGFAWLNPVDGHVETATTLDALSAVAQGKRVLVAVPGQDVLCLRAQWPGGSRQRVRQALPYLLEEQLIGDVERQHFALGLWDGEQLPVVVVARSRMDGWLAQLSAAGVVAQQLVPDCLLADWRDGQWSIHFDADGGCQLRSESQGGFSADVESAPLLLDLAWQQASPRPPSCLLSGEPPQWFVEWAEQQGLALMPTDTSLLAQWAAVEPRQPVIDLLQGGYSRQQQFGRLLRPWLPAAVVFSLWLLLTLGLAGADYWRLAEQRDQLRLQIDRVYLDTFPDAKRVVNARVQMAQRLNELRAGQEASSGAALGLIAALSEAVAAEPAARLMQLRYREGRLGFTLLLPGQQAVEPFKQQLAAHGLELTSVTPHEGALQLQGQLKETGQ